MISQFDLRIFFQMGWLRKTAFFIEKVRKNPVNSTPPVSQQYSHRSAASRFRRAKPHLDHPAPEKPHNTQKLVGPVLWRMITCSKLTDQIKSRIYVISTFQVSTTNSVLHPVCLCLRNFYLVVWSVVFSITE